MDGVDSLTQFAEMIVSGEDFGTVNDINLQKIISN